ncbi:hypothetical protein [Deinococcus roseus]|uniref:CopG family transcriptional regulator n=1 Tax=Deinococcus roseus TaxID=392414 RepID=A0ABQ2D9B0_9DEIO|nr:hypothetical protein [Deinococcus roseus]GGJ47930.1 hypothetical protein GCM10008938_37440 [Deinococcus roseus]
MSKSKGHPGWGGPRRNAGGKRRNAGAPRKMQDPVPVTVLIESDLKQWYAEQAKMQNQDSSELMREALTEHQKRTLQKAAREARKVTPPKEETPP